MILYIVKEHLTAIWLKLFAQKYTKMSAHFQTLLLAVVVHCTQKINMHTIIIKHLKENSFQRAFVWMLKFSYYLFLAYVPVSHNLLFYLPILSIVIFTALTTWEVHSVSSRT